MGIEILITVGLILILSLAIIAAVCLKVLFSMMKYNNQLHDRLMARSLAEYANKQLVDKLADGKKGKGDVIQGEDVYNEHLEKDEVL